MKALLNGVYYVYGLQDAYTTTESAAPYTNPQIIDPYGTERFIDASDREVSIPVGHETEYIEDSVAKLSGLPKDFSTLIAPTEKAYKATRNYTVGSFLIVNNQLYKVTAAIANNGAITPGTNCTATTIAEQLITLFNR